MRSTQKKIGLLFVGSSFNVNDGNVNLWLSKMPELNIIANVKPIFIDNRPTASSRVTVWPAILQALKDSYDSFDGFVVLHDLDNILFTASFLSFAVNQLSKPIVFTGGHGIKNLPTEKDSGIKANIINAAQAALAGFSEVALIFNSQLIRASLATGRFNYDNNSFALAANSGRLGRVDFSLRLFGNVRRLISSEKKVYFDTHLPVELKLIQQSPFLVEGDCYSDSAGAAVVILNHCGLDDKLNSWLVKHWSNRPVVLFGGDSMIHNNQDGFIYVDNMTLEATATKLSWALNQVRTTKDLADLMAADLAGEIIDL